MTQNGPDAIGSAGDQSGVEIVSQRTKATRKAPRSTGKGAAERTRAKTGGITRRAAAAKPPAKKSVKKIRKTGEEATKPATKQVGKQAGKKAAADQTARLKRSGRKTAAATGKSPAPGRARKTKDAAASKPAKPRKSAAAKAPATEPADVRRHKPRAQASGAAETPGGGASVAPPVASEIVVPNRDKVAPSESTPQGAQDSAARPTHTPPGNTADNGVDAPRNGGLLATNAVHATRRRLKRSWHQNRGFLAVGAAVLIGVLILADRSEPPDVLPLEHVSAARTAPSDAGNRVATHGAPAPVDDPVRATQLGLASTVQPPAPRSEPLAADELVEMERMLARLNLEPSRVDGVIDLETKSAIRLYQQIAGLPIDGRPSSALLADMREVVRLMEGAE